MKELSTDTPVAEQVEVGDTLRIEYEARTTGTKQVREGEVIYLTDISSGVVSQSIQIEVEGYSYDAMRVRTYDYRDTWGVSGSTNGRHTSYMSKEGKVYLVDE